MQRNEFKQLLKKESNVLKKLISFINNSRRYVQIQFFRRTN